MIPIAPPGKAQASPHKKKAELTQIKTNLKNLPNIIPP
jgi:hypothetical protein